MTLTFNLAMMKRGTIILYVLIVTKSWHNNYRILYRILYYINNRQLRIIEYYFVCRDLEEIGGPLLAVETDLSRLQLPR